MSSAHYHYVNIMSELTMKDMLSGPLWFCWIKIQMVTLFYLLRWLANLIMEGGQDGEREEVLLNLPFLALFFWHFYELI